ncbi:odorant receptor Or1-like isoform X2 [Diachasmimorpha longicaudata]|uniref:odorant receptor Or1-like isoform X2 n=1 Tax=Diachasmimorpha longicaudata TaxID=58733 RepID=UPI0030B8EBEE
MVLLRESFLSLQYCGIWPPLHLDSKSWQYRAYSLYTIYIVAVMYWFTFSELINLLITTDGIEDFSDTCFMLLSTAAVCAKILITLMKRSEIRDVLVALESYPYKPMNLEEQKIQDEYDGQVRFLTFFYGVATEITVWCMTIFTFFQGIPFGVLPYKAWVPYDYSEPRVYWFTYYQQLLSVLLAANLDIGFDTIIPGFMLQICAQFNILKCRLHRVVNYFDDMEFSQKRSSETLVFYENRLVDCIKYHRDIFEMADKINSLFTSIIFVQYAASFIIICVSVLLISQMPLFSPKFLALFMYLSCMLLQIFMFCAAGNEATIQCQNMINGISGSRWYLLGSRMKKYLVLMMLRTLRPVRFVSGFVIVLSLDSFCILIKKSYSAYTVLQRSSS